MKKTKELTFISGGRGGYDATVYDYRKREHDFLSFIDYTKKEVIQLLRRDGVIVGRWAY